MGLWFEWEGERGFAGGSAGRGGSALGQVQHRFVQAPWRLDGDSNGNRGYWSSGREGMEVVVAGGGGDSRTRSLTHSFSPATEWRVEVCGGRSTAEFQQAV